MLLVRFFKIIRLKCQMEFTLSQVVSLGVVFQPGKLQLKIAHIALQVHNDKILAGLSSYLMSVEGFLVESKRTIQIGYI